MKRSLIIEKYLLIEQINCRVFVSSRRNGRLPFNFFRFRKSYDVIKQEQSVFILVKLAGDEIYNVRQSHSFSYVGAGDITSSPAAIFIMFDFLNGTELHKCTRSQCDEYLSINS